MADSVKLSNNLFPMWPVFTLPANGAFQDALQEMIAETQEATVSWTKRRQEAMEASIRSLQSLYASKDPGGLSTALADWMMKSMELVAAEVRELQDETSRCAEIGQKFLAAVGLPGAEPKKPDPGGETRNKAKDIAAAA